MLATLAASFLLAISTYASIPLSLKVVAANRKDAATVARDR